MEGSRGFHCTAGAIPSYKPPLIKPRLRVTNKTYWLLFCGLSYSKHFQTKVLKAITEQPRQPVQTRTLTEAGSNTEVQDWITRDNVPVPPPFRSSSCHGLHHTWPIAQMKLLILTIQSHNLFWRFPSELKHPVFPHAHNLKREDCRTRIPQVYLAQYVFVIPGGLLSLS